MLFIARRASAPRAWADRNFSGRIGSSARSLGSSTAVGNGGARSVGSITPDAYRNQLDEIIRLIAERMGADPVGDLRPALLVTTMHNAATLAHGSWLAGGGEGDLREVIDSTLRVVERGLESIGGVTTAQRRRRGS